MKSGDPFDTKNGKQIILYTAEIEKALKANNKAFGRTKLKTAAGIEITFGDVIKTKEFGGGTSGSGGGAENTTATESAQCVYAQALWDNPNTKFSPADLAKAYRKCDVNASTDQILKIPAEWINSSILGARVLKKVLSGKQYTWHRGSIGLVKWKTGSKNSIRRIGSSLTSTNGPLLIFGLLQEVAKTSISLMMRSHL